MQTLNLKGAFSNFWQSKQPSEISYKVLESDFQKSMTALVWEDETTFSKSNMKSFDGGYEVLTVLSVTSCWFYSEDM